MKKEAAVYWEKGVNMNDGTRRHISQDRFLHSCWHEINILASLKENSSPPPHRNRNGFWYRVSHVPTRFNFVINAPFIQKVLIFLFQHKVHTLRLIVEHNIRQMSPTTLLSRRGRQCAYFQSCVLVGTPHITERLFIPMIFPARPQEKRNTHPIVELNASIVMFYCRWRLLRKRLQLLYEMNGTWENGGV